MKRNEETQPTTLRVRVPHPGIAIYTDGGPLGGQCYVGETDMEPVLAHALVLVELAEFVGTAAPLPPAEGVRVAIATEALKWLEAERSRGASRDEDFSRMPGNQRRIARVLAMLDGHEPGEAA